MRREYLWALITLIVAIALAIILLNIAKDDASPQTEVCVSNEDRDRIRALELEAYDDAFHNQITRLFSVWLTDPTEQPRRARTGNDTAIKAYLHARKMALEWNPPTC